MYCVAVVPSHRERETHTHEVMVVSVEPSHPPTFTHPPRSVEFQFRHNVVGRRVYAEGTVDAVLFLAKQSGDKKIYNMIDVLRSGAM